LDGCDVEQVRASKKTAHLGKTNPRDTDGPAGISVAAFASELRDAREEQIAGDADQDEGGADGRESLREAAMPE
jgi:hypothetical protein